MASPTLFDKILTQGVREGKIPSRTHDAREWYRKSVSQAVAKSGGKVNENTFLQGDTDRARTIIKPGEMYMYHYDAKHKDTLPYWDRFPMVFPFRVEANRFWGLNLHYLPLKERAMLMDALYTLTNNTRYDESTRLKMSYEVLSGASKFRLFKPCIKQYLYSQLASKFLYIYPSEWDIALFLPVERFVGATKSQVFKDSKQMLRAD
jgi:hypothetical protein